MIDLLQPTQLHHLHTALQACAVQHARNALARNDTNDARAALATSLNSLGTGLRELGRYREALTAFEEALGLWRELAEREPARHTPDLATSLNNVANTLCQRGRHHEELELRAEATARWRMLAQLNPDEHNDAYQRARDQLAASYSQHGHEPDAAWRAEENLARKLRSWHDATKPPGNEEQHAPESSPSMSGLAVVRHPTWGTAAGRTETTIETDNLEQDVGHQGLA